MDIVPLRPSLRDAWDHVVEHSDDAWLFHRYDWGEAVSERVWGYHSHGFLLRDRGRIVGICPLFLRERRIAPGAAWRFLSTSGFGVAGPAFLSELSPTARTQCAATIFAALDERARALRCDRLDVRFPPLAPAALVAQPALALALPEGFRTRSTATYLLSLRGRTVVDLWSQLAKRCRGSIAKARACGVVARDGDADMTMDAYYALHETTYRRTGVQPHPPAYFAAIAHYGWAKRFIAVRDGRIIAAMHVAPFKRGALYWTSASDSEALTIGANNLLQWHAIQWALEHGYEWYDVGEAFPDAPRGKRMGLTRYKASFGGVLVPFHQYAKVYRPLRHASYALLQRAAGVARGVAS